MQFLAGLQAVLVVGERRQRHIGVARRQRHLDAELLHHAMGQGNRFSRNLQRLGAHLERLGAYLQGFGSHLQGFGSDLERLGAYFKWLGSHFQRLGADLQGLGMDRAAVGEQFDVRHLALVGDGQIDLDLPRSGDLLAVAGRLELDLRRDRRAAREPLHLAGLGQHFALERPAQQFGAVERPLVRPHRELGSVHLP